jgi:hypothetical protein
MLLVFESTESPEAIELHTDKEGMAHLIDELKRLMEGTDNHIHLMTPAWAGQDLTEEPVGEGNKTIHQVNVYCWKE